MCYNDKQINEESIVIDENVTDETIVTDDVIDESAESAIVESGTYTSKEEVAAYIYTYGHLPSNFITKKRRRSLDGSAAKEIYGKNLDALHDCLTDLDDLEITITAPEEDGAIFQRVVRIFKASAKENDCIRLHLL